MRIVKVFSQKRILSVGLVVCLTLAALAGCGSVDAGSDDVIELHEPVAGEEAVMYTEPAARRNLYNAQVYSAVVFPYVEEYSYESSRTFGSFAAVPGETVQAGSPLAYMDMEKISSRVEAMEEKISSLTESYEEYRKDAEEELAKLKSELEDLEEILDNLAEEEPEQYVAGADGQEVFNSAYASWQNNSKKWQGQYNSKELSIETKQEALRQKRELYELDYKYYSGQLRKLKQEREEAVLFSKISGQVVAAGEYSPGGSVRANASVIAVGDLNRKYIKCEMIPTVSRLRAEDIYAVIDGRRYEVEYVENNDTDFSLFSIKGDNGMVSVGDTAAIVVVREKKEQVLTVAVDSVHREGLQRYVYVVEDGKAVIRNIQFGASDNVYVEILSGVEEGEEVLISQALTAGSKTAVLEKGTFEITYEGNGELVYPLKTVVRNPVENGEVYFQEYTAAVNQHVEKGDVIAIVRVEGDDVALARKENNLKRVKERLADLIAQGDEKNEETIAQRRESIAEMEEEIAQMKADYGTTEIYATVSGRVLSRTNYASGDLIKDDAGIAVIGDESVPYLSLENPSSYLHWGHKLELSYTDTEGQKRTAEGTVVTLGADIGGVLSSKNVLAALPEGGLDGFEAAKESSGGRYIVVKIKAAAALNAMENVILVPKRAVQTIGENNYVTVLKEDGSVMPVSVIVGGSNRSDYWIIDGLTEGMKICWE